MKKKLLVFHHGLGDVMMFLPLYEHLNRTGEYVLAFQQGLGFTPLVPGSIETPPGDFDYASLGYESFQIVRYDVAEGSGITKTELCARMEFGIDDFSPGTYTFKMPSKVVGVSFQGTCLPGGTNPDELTACKIWKEVQAAGFIPIEVHFEHVYHNPVNIKFGWIDRTTRGILPSVDLLYSFLKSCHAFIGVTSGVWAMAVLMLSHKKVCCLEKQYKVNDFYRYPELNSIDIRDYKEGSVRGWLYSTKGEFK